MELEIHLNKSVMPTTLWMCNSLGSEVKAVEVVFQSELKCCETPHTVKKIQIRNFLQETSCLFAPDITRLQLSSYYPRFSVRGILFIMSNSLFESNYKIF